MCYRIWMFRRAKCFCNFALLLTFGALLSYYSYRTALILFCLSYCSHITNILYAFLNRAEVIEPKCLQALLQISPVLSMSIRLRENEWTTRYASAWQSTMGRQLRWETRPLPFPLRPDCVESHDWVCSSILYEYYQLVSTCVLKMFEARQFEMKWCVDTMNVEWLISKTSSTSNSFK